MEKVQSKDVGPVRLRLPDRSQVQMVIQCPDELIPADHQARIIWRVCQSQDLSEFCEPIKAREGRCGRDATAPSLLVSLWLYAAVRGI
ncbi:MAG TPA: IS5/IS1182 family transposase, partial [Humisphaera sp.]|nr:IS5/IS1182 family transposase [Humisphaera sp.]